MPFSWNLTGSISNYNFCSFSRSGFGFLSTVTDHIFMIRDRLSFHLPPCCLYEFIGRSSSQRWIQIFLGGLNLNWDIHNCQCCNKLSVLSVLSLPRHPLSLSSDFLGGHSPISPPGSANSKASNRFFIAKRDILYHSVNIRTYICQFALQTNEDWQSWSIWSSFSCGDRR